MSETDAAFATMACEQVPSGCVAFPSATIGIVPEPHPNSRDGCRGEFPTAVVVFSGAWVSGPAHADSSIPFSIANRVSPATDDVPSFRARFSR